MEAQEEFIGSNDHTNQIVKRKRTKRQRFSSPIGVTAVTSSSSSGGGGGAVVEDYGSITSPTTSSYIYESTEEEEDMANCLIMLAQGGGGFLQKQVVKGDQIRKEKFRARKIAEIAGVTTTSNKAGIYVYECKTCNRTFPSFQALGGHRASHKKPKPIAMEEEKESLLAVPIVQEIDEESQFNKITPTGVSIQNPNKGKTHECSICGSEFTSGQALGGHMRRHRANTKNNHAVGASLDTSNNTVDDRIEVKARARNFLSLDLNLPAPEDDDDDHHSSIESKFKFATSTQQTLLFSAPALVDCHY